MTQPASSEAEEGDGGRDVRGQAPARDALEHLDEVERLLVRAGERALGLGQARRHRVDRDAVLAELRASARVNAKTPPFEAT